MKDAQNQLSGDDRAEKTALFLQFCSRQLDAAIEDSRGEMDGVAAALLSKDSGSADDILVRLQSVDRLMQRLSNVSRNLVRLEDLVRDDSVEEFDETWARILLGVRESFTMTEERKLFDEVIGDECAADSAASGQTVELF